MDPFGRRKIGRTDVEVSCLGMGGAPLGDHFVKLDEPTCQATLEAAWQAGIRAYDTAPWYGNTLSEHRFGQMLRSKPRDEFMLSTKVGRVYKRAKDPNNFYRGQWVGGLPFERRFDYTYDAVMRSWEDSLQRFGIPRVDLLLIHDLDFFHFDDEATVLERLSELEKGGGIKALQELKDAGEIGGFGAGINQELMIPYFLERFDLDTFLVAMPYTLIDQGPLDDIFPRCAERGIGIIIGSPYASG
ncbi:MAG: aldo/keto reductase, partial [Pseudomonadota bacterium]